jgi:hypothetical protein
MADRLEVADRPIAWSDSEVSLQVTLSNGPKEWHVTCTSRREFSFLSPMKVIKSRANTRLGEQHLSVCAVHLPSAMRVLRNNSGGIHSGLECSRTTPQSLW